MALKIAVAQLNFTTGDSAGNARRIIDAAQAAHAAGARLLLTPARSVCGYLAADALPRPSFEAACDAAVHTIARETAALADLAIVVGLPAQRARVLRDGRVIGEAGGPAACVFQAEDVRIGLLPCADDGFEAGAQRAQAAGAELLAALDATPFHAGHGDAREALLTGRARATGLPLVCARLVGAQDEAVFEGRSLAADADGRLAGRARSFAEQLFYVDAARADAGLRLTADTAPAREREADLWDALVTGLRDYARKNGFKSALLGLSGGIDSALVLALAVDALGRDRVSTVMMPSPYTADISLQDAREMARRLGVRHDELAILPEFERFKQSLQPLFGGKPEDTTEENLQARIRGVMLMALSNKHGHLLLTTGNKSECATGYCTLYGDTCGGFAPINDVFKTDVFRLARWRNAHDPHGGGANPIPERIITRPPSAELRPDQKDQDSLPPYEVLDAIIDRYLDAGADIADLVAEGFDRSDVEHVARLMKASEYKRRQAAPGTRVSRRGFGGGWRCPLSGQRGN